MLEVSFHPRLMGNRCLKNIDEYFHGESKVSANTLNEIEDWLSGCGYQERLNVEGLSDSWLHPLEFENRRGGHCVDFALWCWRKLCELDIKAELMIGERYRDGAYRQHGWVIFTDQGKEYLFEPLPITGQLMISELDEIKERYTPWLSISGDLKYFLFGGYVSAIFRGVK